jgi:cytidine deaminase
MTQPPIQDLIEQAIHATQNAYVPYSDYPVGAALLSVEGVVFTGCNIENASYPVGLCAERTALAKAVSEGVRTFSTIVIATRGGGSPCGMCRQALFEFAPALRVILVDFDGTIHHDTTLDALLPLGFNRDELG